MASVMEVATSMGDNMASTLSIGSFGGHTYIEVHGEDITPEEAEGWSASGKRIKQIMAGKKNGESAAISCLSRPKTRASFAKRVADSVTKAARMPIDMPKEDTKIVMRPHGGLNVGRTEVSIIMSVVMTAARVTKEEDKADTICTNAQQNIIVVSTPDERRATLYSKVKALNIGGRTYEVSAYRTAPDGTVKGVIRGIAVDDTPEEIADSIVNPYNPLAVEAHRIGNTTTVIVLFAGQKVPNYVKYGSILVRCGLYRKHFDVCKQCGKVGHRRDVCPNPNTRVCFGCGIANPGEGHERECKPKCRLCGGQHPTGERECKNKYKMPYVVKKRQWERKMEAMQQQPDPESFPPLRAPSVERPRGESRQRDSGRKRDHSKRGRSASRRRPSQSRERATWADTVKVNMAEKRQPPAQNAAKKIQEMNGMVKALGDENKKLKRRIAEQDATIQEINEKLTTLIAKQQQQQQQLPKPAQERKQEEMTEDEPEVEVDPRTTKAAGPAPKRRAIEGAKERKITERIEKQDDRLDHLEATSKERRLARARALVDLHAREEGAVYVDAAEYRGSCDAYAAVVVGASTGATKTAASVRTREAHRAEEVAIALAVSDPGCTTVLCDSRTAVKNYAKGRVCSEAARILRKAEDIGRKKAVVIKWFPAHMGSDVSERGNANHNETANAAARGLTNRAAANTADSECWSRYSAKDKMTSFNEIVKWYRLNRQTMPPPHPGLTRMEAVLYRQLQTGSLLTPVLAKHVCPSVYASDVCRLCTKERATAAHILWDCSVNPREASEKTTIPPQLEAATRSYDQETQLKAVQQVSAALERQRPSETEEKGGSTPRKGAAALSNPRK
ncbi:hypothetical protein HPB47_018065 [Ixodes persulcatus]|uniref:Uncharacterized protein n=1 Tax=Ixodes persulcatus TaxID=34615 RepID=A0AC60QLQ9_IXOPE|nr:hypothetical protein HPB47_018065 [Ixodes persulcatus]